jgi:alpha-1,2-mannosyltransferase
MNHLKFYQFKSFTFLPRYPDLKVVIYTGDINASPSDIINRVYQRFDIKLKSEIEFVYLHKRPWLEHKRYPYFTLLGQSLGSIIVGIEALLLYLPGIHIS